MLIHKEMNLNSVENCSITILGIGYVGLPLAIEFAKKKICKVTGKALEREVIGFDINSKRIEELKNNIDSTNQLNHEEIKILKKIRFVENPKEILDSDVFIITVPTPINNKKNPNLKNLNNATKTIAKAIKKRIKKTIPVIIYESTVFPGATEEISVPILEKISGLKCNKNFLVGYSPERVNPGDFEKKIPQITKVTSGSNDICANYIDDLYRTIITAGTCKASSIKVAEASKVIENTQRDLNIALVNELSIIFSKMNLDTLEIIEIASSKWNFHKFTPGLVGGHCIGVDPYYLKWKAENLGHTPEVLMAGRKVNENMYKFILKKIIINFKKNKVNIKNSSLLVLGYSYKENCPDIRNSKVINLCKEAIKKGISIKIYDPIANKNYLEKNIIDKSIDEFPHNKKFDAILIAVSHSVFKKIPLSKYRSILKNKGFIFDLKGILNPSEEIIRP